MQTLQNINLAIVGSPNCGKTAFFNALTKSNKKSTNYPGVTIDVSHGNVQTETKNFQCVDLPGLYSFNAQSFDESITRDYIFQQPNKFFSKNTLHLNYDAIIVIVDATQIEKTLYIALELKKLHIPFIMVLTHKDMAQKGGQVLNLEAWKQEWKIPLYLVDNFNHEDIKELLSSWNKLDFEILKLNHSQIDFNVTKKLLTNPQFVADSFKEIDQLLKKYQIQKYVPNSWTKKLDKILLHPVVGIFVMTLVLITVFQFLFIVAAPLQDYIERFFSFLTELSIQHLSPSIFRDLLTEGIIAGVGSVCVFLPQISFLSLLITILEDSGYLSRVAFLLDGFMKRLALPGKAVIPLLTSHACAIPGIMSTRNLDKEEDRITTMMIAPLTTCSARVPVYTLLISALIPSQLNFGPFSYQALAMFFLYFLGIAMSFLVGFILKRKVFKAKAQPLLLQLPLYKLPRFKNVWQNVKMQSLAFLTKAGGVIFILSILIWVLATFPKKDESSLEPHQTYVEIIGKKIQPLLSPLGFDWKLSAALIPSFAAREVMVSALATVNAIELENIEEEEAVKPLKEYLATTYDLGTIVALLLWFVFAPQCISTFAVLVKETHGYFWPSITFLYSITIAYLAAWMAQLIL
jgi:ferrous iron transport protein B